MLAEHIQQLLRYSIDSVEQCEILVALRDSIGTWWTARSLAAELFLAEPPTRRDLEILAGRGLIEVQSDADTQHLRYRLPPGSSELARSMTELADAYHSTRVEVLSYLVSRKGRSVRHFAEAFNFRRDRS